jgi:hypothetical protein
LIRSPPARAERQSNFLEFKLLTAELDFQAPVPPRRKIFWKPETIVYLPLGEKADPRPEAFKGVLSPL